MPPRPRRPYKRHGKSKSRATASRRNLSKFRSKKAPRPRTSPFNPPNEYRFTRWYSEAQHLGTTAGDWLLNTDSRFQIIKLATEFNRLPDYTEFKALFSEFKIHSFTVKLVPYYSRNQPQLTGLTGGTSAIPNYEVFAVPVNYSDTPGHLESKTAAQIVSFLNQSQRTGVSLMPNKTKSYHTAKPKIVKYIGAVGKISLGTSFTAMGSPTWLSTDNTATPDETDVSHYGLQLVIRKVDGTAFDLTATQAMGFRVETHVNFSCRKVQ